jgi:hypothetical protein
VLTNTFLELKTNQRFNDDKPYGELLDIYRTTGQSEKDATLNLLESGFF